MANIRMGLLLSAAILALLNVAISAPSNSVYMDSAAPFVDAANSTVNLVVEPAAADNEEAAENALIANYASEHSEIPKSSMPKCTINRNGQYEFLPRTNPDGSLTLLPSETVPAIPGKNCELFVNSFGRRKPRKGKKCTKPTPKPTKPTKPPKCDKKLPKECLKYLKRICKKWGGGGSGGDGSNSNENSEEGGSSGEGGKCITWRKCQPRKDDNGSGEGKGPGKGPDKGPGKGPGSGEDNGGGPGSGDDGGSGKGKGKCKGKGKGKGPIRSESEGGNWYDQGQSEGKHKQAHRHVEEDEYEKANIENIYDETSKHQRRSQQGEYETDIIGGWPGFPRRVHREGSHQSEMEKSADRIYEKNKKDLEKRKSKTVDEDLDMGERSSSHNRGGSYWRTAQGYPFSRVYVEE